MNKQVADAHNQKAWTIGCALLTLATAFIAGCGAESGEPPSGASEALENGNNALPGSRPYEANFAKLNNRTKGGFCSATLLGPTRTSATWALTAHHCFNSTSDSVSLSTANSGSVNGTQIVFAPSSPDGQTVDAALVKLATPVPVSAGIYFTTADSNGLAGQTKRCYGFGLTTWNSSTKSYSGGGLHWADFQMVASTGANPLLVYVNEPNALGQTLAPGDSGGPCFDIGSDASTALTITSIDKAGAMGAAPTYADETAAAYFSSWVRSFVPRPQ